MPIQIDNFPPIPATSAVVSMFGFALYSSTVDRYSGLVCVQRKVVAIDRNVVNDIGVHLHVYCMFVHQLLAHKLVHFLGMARMLQKSMTSVRCVYGRACPTRTMGAHHVSSCDGHQA